MKSLKRSDADAFEMNSTMPLDGNQYGDKH